MGSRTALRVFADALGVGRRAAPRYTVLMCARLLSARGDQRARLRDLSTCGATIEGTGLPPPGTSVVLKRGAFEAFARIIWADGNRAGLAFEQALTEAELLAQLNPARPAAHAPGLQLIG